MSVRLLHSKQREQVLFLEHNAKQHVLCHFGNGVHRASTVLSQTMQRHDARVHTTTGVDLEGGITPVEKLPDMPGYVCRRQPWRFSKDAPCACENCWLPSKQEAGLLALRHLTQQCPQGHGEA